MVAAAAAKTYWKNQSAKSRLGRQRGVVTVAARGRCELPRAATRAVRRRRSPRSGPAKAGRQGARRLEHAAPPRLVLLPPLLRHVDPAGAEEAPGPIRAADEAVAALARLVLRGARARVRGTAGPRRASAGQQGGVPAGASSIERSQGGRAGAEPHRRGEAPRPPDYRSDAGVEQVLDQDVARVLGAHGARFEQAEARLGEEDQRAAGDQVEGVHRAGQRR
eukprot:scaffold59029_cov45-Phaeocystis_antarctica.AAC.2